MSFDLGDHYIYRHWIALSRQKKNYIYAIRVKKTLYACAFHFGDRCGIEKCNGLQQVNKCGDVLFLTSTNATVDRDISHGLTKNVQRLWVIGYGHNRRYTKTIDTLIQFWYFHCRNRFRLLWKFPFSPVPINVIINGFNFKIHGFMTSKVFVKHCELSLISVLLTNWTLQMKVHCLNKASNSLKQVLIIIDQITVSYHYSFLNYIMCCLKIK